MELEEGMFIRTPLGIDRIIKKRETTVMGETCYLFYLEQDHNLFYTPSSYFSIDSECFEVEEIKASHNITELVEPMDLMYIDISPDDCGGIVVPRVAETLNELNKWKERLACGECILKAVLTKEQIINNWYEVK